jgi:carbonic anhydrase
MARVIRCVDQTVVTGAFEDSTAVLESDREIDHELQVGCIRRFDSSGGARARGHQLTVHAWLYRLTDGLLRDLGFCVQDEAGAESAFARVAGLGTIGGDAKTSPVMTRFTF